MHFLEVRTRQDPSIHNVMSTYEKQKQGGGKSMGKDVLHVGGSQTDVTDFVPLLCND